MSKKRRFYPSSRRNTLLDDTYTLAEQKPLEIVPPFRISDENVNKVFNEWKDRFIDEWVNEVSSINTKNSVSQYTNFILKRLTYAECANLAIDTIVIKAITTISNEIFSKKGNFTLKSEKEIEAKESAKIIKELESQLEEIGFWESLSELVRKSLTYGVAFLYLNTSTEKIAEPLYHNFRTFGKDTNKINKLKVVEPWGVGVSEVNSYNPLLDDYMKPKKWYVGGAGEIDHTRFLSLSFFEVPNLIKPVFNYGGVPLCQLMQDYIKDAEGIRASLSDLFQRFRTKIIKSPKARNDLGDAKARADAINKQQNNLGLLILTDNEEYIETITPITGLDRIQSQAYESMTISSFLPATKLLGISPSGFNATGEYDLENYYDTIAGFQNNIVKPLLLDIAQKVLWGLGYDYMIDFEFENLKKLDKKQVAETESLQTDATIKLIDAGIITSDQAFTIAKEKGLIPQTMEQGTNADDLIDPLNPIYANNPLEVVSQMISDGIITQDQGLDILKNYE